MSIGDEDDDAISGAEGQGTEGQDDGAGGQEADLSAEHADEEADDGQSEEEVAAQPAAQSRGQSRFQTLANERRAARQETEALRRELDELKRQQQWASQQRTQVSEEQERERLALMTDSERATYQINQFKQQSAAERQNDRMQMAAMMDKSSYDAKATIDPVYAKYAPEVERRFQEQARLGRPVERDILLKLLLGEKALSSRGAAAPRRQAKQRVESQRVPSGSGKGDAPSARGRAGDTPESRLKDMLI